MTKGRATIYEDRIDIIKYCIKNKLLEAENYRQLMEIEFLKKLDEVERRQFKSSKK